MRFAITLLVITTAACAAEPPKLPKGLTPLQGTWTAAYEEFGGTPMSRDELVNMKLVVVIKGDEWTISSGNHERKLLLTANPRANPKTLDWYDTTQRAYGKDGDRVVYSEVKGRFLERLGIYAVEGETLKICMGPDDEERPATFSTKGKPRYEMVILHRER